jgi:two-component system chemotaxis sensor kinase CheA
MNVLEDAGLLQEFREEAQDHLSTMESELLQMEKGGVHPDSFHKIFRSAHSIKGASGFLGLTGIGAVSHSAETVLSLLRDGVLDFDPSVAAVLLGAVDVLRRLLDSAPEEGGLDVSPVVRQMEALLDVPTATSVSEEEEEFHEFGPPGERIRTATFRLRQIPSSHHFQYLLCYSKQDLLQRQAKGLSLVVLVRELQNLGMLVDDCMLENTEASDQDDATSMLILFSTSLEPDHMTMATGLPSEQIHQLDLAELLARIRGESLLVQILPPPPRPPAALGPKPKRAKAEKSPPPRPASLPLPAPPSAAPSEPAQAAGNETVRVRLDVLDRLMRLAGELVLVRNRQLSRMEGAALADREIGQRLDQVTSGIQDAVLSARMQPLGNVLSKFQRIVRDLGHKLDKEIALKIEGGETELDRTLLEALSDPLTHIVRNCCDHGIEMPADRVRAGKSPTGTISVTAWHEAGQVHVRIRDDGKGIDSDAVRAKALEKGLCSQEDLAHMSEREASQMVFLPGFSTAAAISDLSGRGVGMDVVKSAIERLGGSVALDSETGLGTTLDLQLPLTLAIIPALVVMSGGMRFAIPQASVDELVRLYDENVLRIESAGREDLYRLRGHLLPMVSLRHVLSTRTPLGPQERAATQEADRLERNRKLEAFRRGEVVGISETFAVLKSGLGRFGLVLDAILGTEEIVVEPLHPGLRSPAIYSGATVLGDGEIALILDTQGICRHAGLKPAEIDNTELATAVDEARRMLLFRSGSGEQMGLPLSALRRVVRMDPERIERSGEREYVQIEERSVRVERLDNLLPISATQRDGDGYILLPSGDDRSWGILASALVDCGEYRFHPDLSPEDGPLVYGTALLRGHRTLLLDESRLREALSR